MVAKGRHTFYWYSMSASSIPAPAVQRILRRIERDFHVRAFGEEIARINFLPEKRRKQAVAEMIDHAASKGVKLSRPPRGFPI